ncbi:MAG: glycosyltransferase family 2 protein [Deferrisomatales bacterium]
MRFSVVLPNYNGRMLFERHFPSVHGFARELGADLVVVDDASADDSAAFLARRYPDVRVLVNPVNLGFSETCNRGVEAARGDHVFLFNTDVEVRRLDPGVIAPYTALEDFFGLTFLALNPGSLEFREGAKRLTFKRGLPFMLHNPGDQRRDRQGRWVSAYPVGGHCLVSRPRFLELGGFRAAYSPFYWEDADLGFRARRRGWTTYFDERLQVVHHHEGTIRTHFDAERIRAVKLRNRILFMMLNLGPGAKAWRFYPGLAARALVAGVTLDPRFFRALAAASKRRRADGAQIGGP